jgi:hypothetical protein
LVERPYSARGLLLLGLFGLVLAPGLLFPQPANASTANRARAFRELFMGASVTPEL